MIRSFDEILAGAAALPSRRIVVAGAAKASVVETMALTAQAGLIEPTLIGPKTKIISLAEAAGFDSGLFRIVDECGDERAICAAAIAELNNSGAAMLMKGSVSTGNLLRAALAESSGLRTGRQLSHIAVTELASYDRLMLHTDGGINPAPDDSARRDILANAVELSRRLGNAEPNVACLALLEQVTDKLPETGAMKKLSAWANSGVIGSLVCEGPVSWDIALSREVAATKGVSSSIAGKTDIFVGPTASAVNFVVKSLVHLAGAKVAGLLLGAKVPIVMLSRSDSVATRRLSLALGAVYSESNDEAKNSN